MYVNFALTDIDINEKEAKDLIKQAVKYKVDGITVPFFLVRKCKYLVDTDVLDYSCLIDYPLGISDLKTRAFAVEQAILAGVNTIDISMPQNIAANRLYSKIREDVKVIKETCLEKKIKIRYILEYRVFDHRCLKKICEIFDENNIGFAFPSSGYFLDNIADNLIASAFLHQNSKEINVIASGNVWRDHHFEILLRSGMYGFRTSSISAIVAFRKFLNSTTKI